MMLVKKLFYNYYKKEFAEMNAKKHYSRLILCIIFCILLFVLMAGCSTNVVVPPEIDLSNTTPVPVEEIEETEDEELPVEVQVPSKEVFPQIEGSFPEAYKAYLDILAENHSTLMGDQMDDVLMQYGMDICGGKITLLDVFGDETPELLYIYTEVGISALLHLKVLAYSESEGVESIFDERIFTISGGEGYYCVYLTQEGELMGYYSRHDATDWYGFWHIVSAKDPAFIEYKEPYFGYDNNNSAKLYYSEFGVDGEPIYSQYGKTLSENQFDQAAKEIMDDIDRVLFQGVVYQEFGLGLYKYNDYWKDIIPFEEHCMTYNGAISWLEAQLDGDN